MNAQPLSSPTTQAPHLRPDLLAIADLIEPGTRVLDIGCGDGALLEYLRDRKQVRGRGIELTEAGVLACVRRGLSVRQGNVQEGLADYPDQSFDIVILSQTLPFLDDPKMVLGEMLRVGRTAIVSFSNWGHWRCRLELLLTGAPRSLSICRNSGTKARAASPSASPTSHASAGRSVSESTARFT
jgi:methionine biosynthesis protein MetW